MFIRCSQLCICGARVRALAKFICIWVCAHPGQGTELYKVSPGEVLMLRAWHGGYKAQARKVGEQAWNKLQPVEFIKNCRLIQYARNVLKYSFDSIDKPKHKYDRLMKKDKTGVDYVPRLYSSRLVPMSTDTRQ